MSGKLTTTIGVQRTNAWFEVRDSAPTARQMVAFMAGMAACELDLLAVHIEGFRSNGRIDSRASVTLRVLMASAEHLPAALTKETKDG